MNKDLQAKWDEAAKTGEPVTVGELVVCDAACNEDYTNSDECGGFIFNGSAYCPKCAVGGMKSIKRYNEERFIQAGCPEGVSFADFVRAYRGPGANISITKGEMARDVMRKIDEEKGGESEKVLR